mmetsp:Transcript_20257/g.34533  ORF Transcript_20257/g.34533 Transcript_20257/m.34533 type:complete len:85 (+) Transcript_20257:526-780(+)
MVIRAPLEDIHKEPNPFSAESPSSRISTRLSIGALTSSRHGVVRVWKVPMTSIAIHLAGEQPIVSFYLSIPMVKRCILVTKCYF